MSKKLLLLVGVLIAASVMMTACAGPAGPEGPAGPAGPAGADAAVTACSECHNDTTLISGKTTAWASSAHGSNTSFARGSSTRCVACHSGAGFSTMVAAGLTPFTMESGDPEPTRQDCRACHAIHTSYTSADWALETTAAVALTISGVEFDGGTGNLCANCHQSRSAIEVVDGMVDWGSHYGPHHGVQSDMLMGVTGAGDVEGKPSTHYSMVENTCVSCHLGEGDDHSFEPDVAACQTCHADLANFDYDGVQTEVEEKMAELGELLVAAGLMDDEGEPVEGEIYAEAEASALWNYILVLEDGSMGVHNSKYTIALLDWSIAQLPELEPETEPTATP